MRPFVSYVSFACSFAFAERQLMEGNAKIIKFIARDEALHLTGTQHILNIMAAGQDDPEMAEIAEECKQEAYDLFLAAAEQEKDWADYLFKDGSMIGLNRDIFGAIRGIHHQYPYAGGWFAIAVPSALQPDSLD